MSQQLRCFTVFTQSNGLKLNKIRANKETPMEKRFPLSQKSRLTPRNLLSLIRFSLVHAPPPSPNQSSPSKSELLKLLLKLIQSVLNPPPPPLQVTLLWEDQTRRHLLASTRLYFLPEDTPKGRTKEHGEVGQQVYHQQRPRVEPRINPHR